VKLSLSLPFTKDEFTEDKQSKFRESLAVAADVKPADVKIDKIETIVGRRGAGRRLLAGSIRVDTSIRAADNAQAGSMAKRLTADNINAELAKVGLPKSTILEAPKVANEVQGEPNIVPTAQPPSSNNNIPAAAGAGAGVGIVLVLALVCVYLQYRRKPTPKDVVEDNVGASVGHENDFVISVQSRPPVSEHRSGAYQLPDSAAITKRLHAFYSRVNPAKAEQAALVWKTLEREYGANASEELNKMLRAKYGCDISDTSTDVETQNQLPAAVESRSSTPHTPQAALVLHLRNSPSQAPTFSATPATKLLQMSPFPLPAQADAAILYQSDAAILDQLNAFYSHYDQKNAGKASIVWRDLQVLFAGNAATELEKALMIKYGSNLSTFAKMKSARERL